MLVLYDFGKLVSYLLFLFSFFCLLANVGLTDFSLIFLVTPRGRTLHHCKKETWHLFFIANLKPCNFFYIATRKPCKIKTLKLWIFLIQKCVTLQLALATCTCNLHLQLALATCSSLTLQNGNLATHLLWKLVKTLQ